MNTLTCVKQLQENRGCSGGADEMSNTILDTFVLNVSE